MDKKAKNNATKCERRKYIRKNIATSVAYRVVTPLGGEGTTRNISEGGLSIVLDKEVPIGTILELKFDLPGDEAGPVETFAKVVWQRKESHGFVTGLKLGT